MNFKTFLSCSAAFAVFGATTAFAADATNVAPWKQTIVGYLEAHGGWESGSSTNYNPTPNGTATWSDYQFGGSGRAAAIFSSWSAQADIWTGVAIAPDKTSVDSGISGHLTWHSLNGAAMLGVLGSLGTGGFNTGLFGNAGLEAVINADRWRFYAQTGLAAGLSGDASTNGEQDVYATLSVNYFFTPNLFLSANIGVDKWSQSNGDSSPEMSWGGKFEFKPDTSPVSFFAAYQGFSFRSDYGASSDHDEGTDHVVFVGARVPFGVNTLKDLQRTVGLSDLNPLFGDPINR